MKKLLSFIPFAIILIGCASNEQSLTSITGTITELTEEEQSTRILVESEEERIIFVGLDEENLQIHDRVTVTYDSEDGINDSDPQQIDSVEDIEVH
ncbi:hypothetical protein [Alkalicoccobacillus porphyridii]|uniref:DUF3221 domain-containing protein n=1 Tax=Alkalicoccobacillus porphyridii TaxID=2597270 RepID=A0A553ZVT5_9BACI|nr:hypothetical protein [Alkalicoccobacillus porphyridii]TSB45584.1 hypothetical protein FN960_15555 [Alkalicoccobacillus porphyridii]